MPMLYRLMFHMPMSSPQRIRMFGFFVAIAVLPPFSGKLRAEEPARIPRRTSPKGKRHASRDLQNLGRSAKETRTGSLDPVNHVGGVVNETDEAIRRARRRWYRR